jgi:DNA-directed RNA polymerase subunit RPC12/RpoP
MDVVSGDGPSPRYTFECQRCVQRFDNDDVLPCPRCGSVTLTVVRGRIPADDRDIDPGVCLNGPNPPLPEVTTDQPPIPRRRIRMARRVRTAATTGVENTPAPTTTRRRAARAGSSTQVEGAATATAAPARSSRKAAPPVSARFRGTTSGMSVREFQNKLMKDNYRAKLTDDQLADLMREEFPNAIPYTVDHVAGIRSAWNNGRHGNEVPAKPLTAFDVEGNAIAPRTRRRANGEASAEATSDQSASVGRPQVAKIRKVRG